MRALARPQLDDEAVGIEALVVGRVERVGGRGEFWRGRSARHVRAASGIDCDCGTAVARGSAEIGRIVERGSSRVQNRRETVGFGELTRRVKATVVFLLERSRRSGEVR